MATSSRTQRALIWVVVMPLAIAAGLEVGARTIDRARGEAWDPESARRAIAEVHRKLSRSWADPNAEDVKGDPVIVQPFTGWEHPRTQQAIADDVAYYRTDAAEAAYDVCILGGSVAQLFAQLGKKALAESLHRDPRFADRVVRVHDYALAGYKEPQQATMLAYLLALGHRPDAVINLDGFNEAALGFNNAALGSHPLYPHVPHWSEAGTNIRSEGDTVTFLHDVRTKQARARDFGRWFLESGLWRSCFLHHAGTAVLGKLRQKYVNAYGRLMDEILRGPKDAGIHGPAFDASPEALVEAIGASWTESSASLHGMCSVRGIPYLHVLQPTLHDTGSKTLTQKEIDNSTMDPDWVEGVHRMYPRFRELGPGLAARGIAFYDASGIFRDHPEDVYYDICHFAEHGNGILGTAIGSELARIDSR